MKSKTILFLNRIFWYIILDFILFVDYIYFLLKFLRSPNWFEKKIFPLNSLSISSYVKSSFFRFNNYVNAGRREFEQLQTFKTSGFNLSVGCRFQQCKKLCQIWSNPVESTWKNLCQYPWCSLRGISKINMSNLISAYLKPL